MYCCVQRVWTKYPKSKTDIATYEIEAIPSDNTHQMAGVAPSGTGDYTQLARYTQPELQKNFAHSALARKNYKSGLQRSTRDARLEKVGIVLACVSTLVGRQAILSFGIRLRGWPGVSQGERCAFLEQVV